MKVSRQVRLPQTLWETLNKNSNLSSIVNTEISKYLRGDKDIVPEPPEDVKRTSIYIESQTLEAFMTYANSKGMSLDKAIIYLLNNR